jgi:transcriptional regulator with XRE-family HTH domain
MLRVEGPTGTLRGVTNGQDMTLSEFLRTRRTVPRPDVAEAACAIWLRDHGATPSGISDVSIGFWERAVRAPSAAQARALAEALGATPAEIVTVLTELLPAAEVSMRRPVDLAAVPE